jgi:hypothetical protein
VYLSVGYKCTRHCDWIDVTLNILLITRIGTDGPGSASGQGCTVLSLGCQIRNYSGSHPVATEGQVLGGSRLSFTIQNERPRPLKYKTHPCLMSSFKNMWSCTSTPPYVFIVWWFSSCSVTIINCNPSSGFCVKNGVFKHPHIIVNNMIKYFTTQWLLYASPLLALQDLELWPQSSHTSHHSEIALCSVLVTRYSSGDQIKTNEMGGPCGT